MTLSPRAFSRRPKDAAVIPLPRLETTPPVTNMCFATSPPIACQKSRRVTPPGRPSRRSATDRGKSSHGSTGLPGGGVMLRRIDATEAVEGSQKPHSLNDFGERPQLGAEVQGQQHDGRYRRGPRRQRERKPQADDRPERVGAGIAEHGAFPEV